MERIMAAREAAQPIREKTGGSTFKNPKPDSAWKLIDAAGCRGLVMGDAQVSEMHCNFLINRGSATAADIDPPVHPDEAPIVRGIIEAKENSLEAEKLPAKAAAALIPRLQAGGRRAAGTRGLAGSPRRESQGVPDLRVERGRAGRRHPRQRPLAP